MEEHIPAEGTLGYIDYLLDGLEGEIRLSERYDIALDSIQFYRDMLRAAYEQALQQKDGDGRSEA